MALLIEGIGSSKPKHMTMMSTFQSEVARSRAWTNQYAICSFNRLIGITCLGNPLMNSSGGFLVLEIVSVAEDLCDV